MKIYDDQLIVITGGAGFIGSCLVRYLNNKGMTNLLIVDELGHSEKWKNLVGKKFVDIIPKHQLFNWLNGKESLIEAFVHLGACSNTLEKDASYLLENNYRYTVQLAEYALKHEHRFIYASSAATYGDGLKGFQDKENELYSLEPLNMYGFSKQLFDQWAYTEGALEKIVGLKYFNVFGPNEYHKGRMASAVNKMVPEILKGETVKLFKSSEPHLYADGEQKRDFIYVKDVVRITCAFLENDVGGLYNVGSGEASTWNSLTHAVFKALDCPVRIEYVDMPKELVGKYQNYSRADTKKLETILKDQSHPMLLEAAIEDYVKNYLVTKKIW
ncbi:ADP-glyceromanno-heptose 6-epimerase [Candidatus Protochlamydia amoebophila]|nr:ADP-glyceromanno-heptose 6-epimerase [Candidatus Protochlamydia amoebophila]